MTEAVLLSQYSSSVSVRTRHLKRGDLFNLFTIDVEREMVVVLGILPEVDDHFFSFLYVQTKVVLRTPEWCFPSCTVCERLVRKSITQLHIEVLVLKFGDEIAWKDCAEFRTVVYEENADVCVL